MQRLVSLSKIFSDANRLDILALILREKQVCVCEVCDTLNLSQPLVSRHLKMMKKAQILEATQEGRWIVYTLIEDPDSTFSCFINEIEKSLDTLPKLIVCNRKHPKS